MASDEIVWQVINQQFCAFKLKTTKNQTFCRNEYNVTGLCNRQACPLANSRYATIREHNGRLYLYQKTIERAHTPNKLWERILLSQNYVSALAQIDERMIYWPKFLIHKCKQRLTRLVQVAITTRRIIKEETKMVGEKLVAVRAPKIRRREATRERKALAAARLEREIEKELVERLRSGAYGDKPLNVDEAVWKKVLRVLEKGGEARRDVDYDVEEDEELEEEELEEELEGEEGVVEYVSGDEDDEEDMEEFQDWLDDQSGASSFEASDDEEDSEDSSSDDEDDETPPPGTKSKSVPTVKTSVGDKRKRPTTDAKAKARKRSGAGPQVEIEYEHETISQRQTEQVLN